MFHITMVIQLLCDALVGTLDPGGDNSFSTIIIYLFFIYSIDS